jgi:hypothetical protein
MTLATLRDGATRTHGPGARVTAIFFAQWSTTGPAQRIARITPRAKAMRHAIR